MDSEASEPEEQPARHGPADVPPDPALVSRLILHPSGPAPAAELVRALYSELRCLARAMMTRIPPGNTLQPTALVHEAYLRLVGTEDPGWNGKAHFFGAAARAMRDILVDQARRKASRKRGGDRHRVDIEEAELSIASPSDDMLALDEALERLAAESERAAQIVMLRFFAGLTIEETARCLEVSTATVEREWRFARTYLFVQLRPPETN